VATSTLASVSPRVSATATLGIPSERTIQVTALAVNPSRALGNAHVARVVIRPKTDSGVRVGFFEKAAGGIGPYWRSAAWAATTASALMLGVDLSAYEISFDVGIEAIDGPSASGLMTVAVLAGLLGDDVRSDAAMTGTINPDGTIGPVGGVPQKIEGAAQAGKKLVVVPSVNRTSEDLKSKQMVDVVEWGRKLGVEVRPVGTVYEAYEILTGKKLPRPVGTKPASISSRAATQFSAGTKALLTRYNQEIEQFNTLPENIRASRAEGVQRAAGLATSAVNDLQRGAPEVGFQHAFEALSLAVTLNSATRLDQLYLNRDYAGMVAQVKTLGDTLPLDPTLNRLKAVSPQTAADAVALMDAYSDEAAAFALAAEGLTLLDPIAKNVPTSKPSEAWLHTLYRANGDFADASVYLELVNQLLTTYVGFGQAGAPSETRAAAMAETLQRAAEANLAYFESTLDDAAQSLGMDAGKLRGTVLDRDADYRNARYSLAGINYASERLGTGMPASLMQLGSSLNAYAYSAVLIAKYYSLDAKMDADFKITGFGNEQGLADMLTLADQHSSELLSLVEKEEPLPALFYYDNARTFREEAAQEKVLALFYFWEAAAEAQVLANFADVYAQAVQQEITASGRTVSPLLQWGWRNR
jgi:hypothetical protein